MASIYKAAGTDKYIVVAKVVDFASRIVEPVRHTYYVFDSEARDVCAGGIYQTAERAVAYAARKVGACLELVAECGDKRSEVLEAIRRDATPNMPPFVAVCVSGIEPVCFGVDDIDSAWELYDSISLRKLNREVADKRIVRKDYDYHYGNYVGTVYAAEKYRADGGVREFV